MLRMAVALCLLFGVSVQAAAQNGEVSCLEKKLISASMATAIQECKEEFLARKQEEISLRTESLVKKTEELLKMKIQNGPGGTPWSPTVTERIRGSIPKLGY